MSKRNVLISLILLYGVMIFLTLNRHSRSGVQNYYAEIYADKAGYYIYLPAFFIYDFNAKRLPNEIDKKTGYGFSITEGLIKTKYPYGVALLQSPFFIVAHIISSSLGGQNDGFSLIYHKMIDVSAITYAFIALILLYLFLIRYIPKHLACISIGSIFLGTNLFYFSFFETGMSHIYSFFLFTCFLYLSPYVLKPKQKIIFHVLFGIVLGLIVVVRPINILGFPVYFIFNKFNFNELKKNIMPLFIIMISAIIILIPQLIYWKYSSGNYFLYSYENEGFPYWSSPKILNLWFSTNNGLFIYSPFLVFPLLGICYIRHVSLQVKLLVAAYFLLITYIFASWHDWAYGCSYGCRPYVEYYAILSLPLCYFLKEIEEKKYLRFFLGFLFLITIIYNLKLVFSYDGCWYGGTWDWKELFKILISETK